MNVVMILIAADGEVAETAVYNDVNNEEYEIASRILKETLTETVSEEIIEILERERKDKVQFVSFKLQESLARNGDNNI